MEDFDDFSRNYKEMLDKSVGIAGENSEYFAQYKARYIAESVLHNVPSKILDYGCGVGLLSSFLKKYFPDARLHGYDVSAESIGMIETGLAAQGLFTSDVGQLDSNYDLIVVSNVMHHIDAAHRQETVLELQKRISMGGKLTVFEHNPVNPLTRWVVHHCPFDRDAVLLSPKELARYCVQAGLRLVRCDYIVFFPRPLSWLRILEPFMYWCPLGAQYALLAKKGG